MPGIFSDRHNEAQVGLNKCSLGDLALTLRATQFALLLHGYFFSDCQFSDSNLASFDGFSQSNFVVFGEQCVLTNISEVEADEVFVVAVNSIFGHCHSEATHRSPKRTA